MATPAKRLFPAFLDLEARLVIVIGEGPAAEKRVRQMVRYGADVMVVNPGPSDELLQGEVDGLFNLERRGYVRGDLSGAWAVICLVDDDELRRAVFEEAESVGCLANIAGAPEFSSFILPSVFHRGPLQVAISTGGGAPAVAKALRKRLESDIGPEWEAWIALLGEVRVLAGQSIEDAGEREQVMKAASDPSVRDRLAAGEQLTASGLIEETLPGALGNDE